MTVKTAKQLLEHLGNELGWMPEESATRPRYMVMATYAKRINAAIAKKPKLHTWGNLELAVAYLRAQRKTITSPLAVFAYIEPALKLAPVVVVRPLGDLIDGAIAQENSRQLPGWEEWRDRLARAFGEYRREVYAEWQTERGGS